MKSQGKIIATAVLTAALVTGLAATTLTGSHSAEAKTKQKAHAKNHCKISNKNNHHSHDNVNENQQLCVSAAVNLKNVDVDLNGLFD